MQFPNGSVTDNGDGTCNVLTSSVTFVGDLDLEDATPHLRWTDTTAGEDDWEASVNADRWLLATTDGTTTEDVIQLTRDAYFLPRLQNCSTMGTDGVGQLICGTGGSSAGDIESVAAGSGLTGGGTSGAVTLTVGAGTGITVNADDVALTVPVVVSSGGTGATTLTDGGILLGSGTGAITPLGVATNGQIPIGDGATDPVLATLTGTANEITVTNGAGSITLDIPDPLIVGKGGSGAATFTDGGILLGSGTGAFTALGVASNGQVPIGDGTTDPVLATLTGTANQVTVTNGAGTITLSTPQDIATSSSPTFVDLTLTGSGPQLNLQSSGGTAYELSAETTTMALSSANYAFLQGSDAGITRLGTIGFPLTRVEINTSVTGDAAFAAPGESISVGELDSFDVPAEEECATYEQGSIEWQSCGGGGGSPAGSGTELQYRVDGSTFGAVTSSSVSGAEVTLAGDLHLSGFASPQIDLTPTSGEAVGLHAELYGASESLLMLRNGADFVLTSTPTQLFLGSSGSGTGTLTAIELATTTTGDGALRVPANSIGRSELAAGAQRMEKWWSCSGLESLEVSDAITPISKSTGTNFDALECLFDASAVEGRKVVFQVSPSISTSDSITFTFAWNSGSGGATTGNAVWATRCTQTGTNDELWDNTPILTRAAASAVSGTGQAWTITTVTTDIARLGWAASDVIACEVQRFGNDSADTMTGDANLQGFGIRS